MTSGLDFSPVTVKISNHFEGPNFVKGLAEQSGTYSVLSDQRAILEFDGGFNSDVTYVQVLFGENFGIDENGRYTGTVESYRAFEKDDPRNHWTFENLNT